MHILWKLEKAFVKELMVEFKRGKPHYNTLSTMVRNLEEKGTVSHNAFGKAYQYFPIVKKEEYRKQFMNTAIDYYFNNSYKNRMSFFAKEEKISELEYELKEGGEVKKVVVNIDENKAVITD